MRRLLVVCLAVAALLVAATGAPVKADVLRIEFTGLDLTWDGSTLYDTDDIAGGIGDPTESTPLLTMVFFINNVPVLTLTGPGDGIFLDVALGFTSIPETGTASTTGGIFDLLMFDAWGLALDVASSDLEVMTFIIGGTRRFVLSAGMGSIFFQDLPPGIPELIDDFASHPIQISFSSQIDTFTASGGDYDSFRTLGTGEVAGDLVPEPSSCVLMAMGVVLGAVAWRRRHSKAA